ncbi:MAG: rod shape-determining protein MreD [Nitrospirae bacterium]|nr:rod shape-determining protein MreD [Candidatus Manganitrophaceae bacterium]
MRWLSRIVIFLLLIPAQTLLLEQIKIGGIKPDLALILVYCFGWAGGEVRGLLWGVALGGLVDFFSIGLLSVNFFLKMVIGFTVGMLGRSLLNLSFLWNTLIFFFVSILHDLLGTLIIEGVGEGGLFPMIHREMIGRAFYNSFFAAGLLFLFAKRRAEKGTIDHAGILFTPGGNPGSAD